MASASEAKAALLGYLRFERQMPYVATEVTMPAGSLGDIVCSNAKILVEYEVKISMSDFNADFKKEKHYYYINHPVEWKDNVFIRGDLTYEIKEGEDRYGTKGLFIFHTGTEEKYPYHSFKTVQAAKDYLIKNYSEKSGTPNQFYYVMPKNMWTVNQEKIKAKLKNHYGVITFEDSSWSSMEVQVLAKKLHTKAPSANQLLTIVKRMSSELAGITKLHYDYVNDFSKFKELTKEEFNLGDIDETIPNGDNPETK